jgi:hypothetical protein
MEKFTIVEFMQTVFDEKATAERASEIGEGILAGRSLRMTDIANQMQGNTDAAYKRIQRFIEQEDAREVLGRLHQPTAEFMIGDPTEIERPEAGKTEYVGTLKDGKTKGFWCLVLATPYRGRAIPCGFVTYSSKTIANNQDSRNLNHFRAFESIKDLLGDKPLVLDREFSYLELLLNLIEEQVSFVIRLNLGSHPPTFYDQEGKIVALTISAGETVTLNKVWYKGKACVNLIGKWRKGLSQPLWVMTNLEAQKGLHIYFERMKIEQSFKDLKDLLGMTKLMYKKQEHMEKMIALLLIVFSIGLLVGENLRDFLYGQPIGENEVIPQEDVIPDHPQRRQSKKWKLYSGLFILLRQKLTLSNDQFAIIIQQTITTFSALVHFPVRSPVRT